jgi:tetratricopeptide (TPR) repeat protein
MSDPSSLLLELSEGAMWRLEEACCRFEEAWQAGRPPRLEDFAAGAERDERLALLRELLRLEVYYRRQAGEGPSAADYQTRFPEATAVLQEVFASPPRPDGLPAPPGEADDPEQTGPELLAPTSDEEPAVGNGDVPVSEAPGEAEPSRYRTLRFHARGNLGEVFVAEDTELHREVALKEIKPENARRPDSRGRFVLEAEVTGRLEHPGVVPVYGLGTYADGRPYYAMRFIRGQELAKAIAAFHGQAPARFDSLEFRGLLGRFVAVCQAVAYAHSRGVLHRDLKPGNIMLGEFGETLVVDWGLARVLGRPGADRAVPDEEERLRVRGDGWAATAAGAMVGTPAFMSPEQARGAGDELGPATDVYGLGATLYALLTNQAPFQGKVAEVLSRVERGAWRPARQVNPAVPAALEAICGRAMAPRPEERYGSALELAGDVEHWLADEPVAAYREPAGARLRRWVRKHPRRVTAAGVLLLATVVGLTTGTVLLERSKREAQDNFEMAQGAVDKCLNGVSEEFWMDEPAMQPMREKLLRQAEEYGWKWLEKYPGDQRAGQQYAKTMRLLGELNLQTNREDEGIACVDRARKRYEDLLKQAPADRGLRFGLAHTRQVLADHQLQKGKLEDGEKELDRAMALLEPLTAEEAENESFRGLLALSYNLRAMAKWSRGDVESGLADNRKVLEIVEDLLSAPRLGAPLDKPGGSRPWRGYFTDRFAPIGLSYVLLPRAYTNRGIMLHSAGRNAEAARVLQEATAVDRWLLRQEPQLGRFRQGLAQALLHSGHVQIELGRPRRGGPALREALELARKLVDEDPLVPAYKETVESGDSPGALIALVPEYREILGQAAGYLGEDLFVRGQTAEAAKLLREALTVPEDAGSNGSKDRTALTCRARFNYVLGCLERESGHLAEGLRYCEEARREQEQALQEAPGDPSLRGAWLGAREELALCRFQRGDINRDDCIAEQQSVLEERKKLAGPLRTRAPRFQGELAASAALRAGLLLEGGRPAEALTCVDEVLPDHERFVREEQERAGERAKKRAEANKPPDNPDPRSERWPVYLPGRAVEPDDLALRRQWALLLARRAAALAGVGSGPAAVKTIRWAIAMTEGLVRGDHELRCPPASPLSAWSFLGEELCRQEPCYRYDLACHLALASTLPGNAGLDDPAGRAVQALRDHIASGFDNAYKLRTDPALAPLRQRHDFEKLVRGLEARVKGKEPT